MKKPQEIIIIWLRKGLNGRYVNGFTLGHLLPPARINTSKLINQCSVPSSIFQANWQIFLQIKVLILTIIYFNFLKKLYIFFCLSVLRKFLVWKLIWFHFVSSHFYFKRSNKPGTRTAWLEFWPFSFLYIIPRTGQSFNLLETQLYHLKQTNKQTYASFSNRK